MIIVTDGSGRVGRAAVKDLMEKGYTIASVDMVPQIHLQLFAGADSPALLAVRLDQFLDSPSWDCLSDAELHSYTCIQNSLWTHASADDAVECR